MPIAPAQWLFLMFLSKPSRFCLIWRMWYTTPQQKLMLTCLRAGMLTGWGGFIIQSEGWGFLLLKLSLGYNNSHCTADLLAYQ
jgi:hypothetical protein